MICIRGEITLSVLLTERNGNRMKKVALAVLYMLFVFMVPFSVHAEDSMDMIVQTGTGEGVNIRLEPSTDSMIYDTAYAGMHIKAYDECENGFRKILYDGQEMWAYAQYLTIDYTNLSIADDESVYTFDSGNQIGFNNYPADFTGVIVKKTYQKMKLVVDGEEIFVTDVVTGTRYSRDTPAGEFEIWFKETNFTFEKYGVTSEYFMPLKWKNGYGTDYGFHDASWRYGQFGGNIYEENGSHGCINMPLDEARTLYEYAYEGMPVYILE